MYIQSVDNSDCYAHALDLNVISTTYCKIINNV